MHVCMILASIRVKSALKTKQTNEQYNKQCCFGSSMSLSPLNCKRVFFNSIRFEFCRWLCVCVCICAESSVWKKKKWTNNTQFTCTTWNLMAVCAFPRCYFFFAFIVIVLVVPFKMHQWTVYGAVRRGVDMRKFCSCFFFSTVAQKPKFSSSRE